MALLFSLADGVPEGITAFVVSVCTIIGAVIKGVKMWRAKQDKAMKAVPSSDPAPRHSVLERRLDKLETGVRDVAMAQAEWREAELVARIGELEKTVADLTVDLGRRALAISTERVARQRIEARFQMECDHVRILEDALAKAGRERDQALRQLAACQRTVEELRSGKAR